MTDYQAFRTMNSQQSVKPFIGIVLGKTNYKVSQSQYEKTNYKEMSRTDPYNRIA